MSDGIYFLGKKYISSKRASEISGYTNDYIGQICREEKIKAKRVGRDWFIDQEFFIDYCREKNHLKTNEEEKKKTPFRLNEIALIFASFAVGIMLIAGIFLMHDYLLDIGQGASENAKIISQGTANYAFSIPQGIYQGTNEISGRLVGLGINIENLILGVTELGIDGGNTLFSSLTFPSFSNFNNPFSILTQGISENAKIISQGIYQGTNEISGRLVGLGINIENLILGVTELGMDGGRIFSDNVINGLNIVSDSSNYLLTNAFSSSIKANRQFFLVFGNISIGSGDFIASLTSSIKEGVKEFKDAIVNAPKNVKETIKDMFGNKEEKKTIITKEQPKKTPSVDEGTLGVENGQASDIEQLNKEISQTKKNGFAVEGQVAQKTIVEKTIERVVSGLSNEELDVKLQQLNNKLMQEILGVKNQIASKVSNSYNASVSSIYQAVANTQRIDNLSGATLNNTTFTGTVSGLSLTGDYLELSGGTLTGALTGTDLTLSGFLSVTGTSTLSATTTLNGVSYTWPSADGTNGQALITDSLGTLSWSSVAASGGAGTSWDINAGGLLAPTTTLSVLANSNLFVTGDTDIYGGDINLGTGIATSTLTSLNGLLGLGSTTPWATLSIEGTTEVAANSPLFVLATSTPTATSTAFIVDGSGNVGIGTSTPGNTFAVQGTGAFDSWLSADYFLATSTTATSTFSGPVAINGNTRITDKNSTPPALISFTFDDTYATDRTIMYDVFNSAGVPATTYIVTDQIGQGSRLTSAQILELAAAGWEIGAHTMTHGISGNNDLTTGTEAQIEAELLGSKNVLAALGLTVTSAAYPQGKQNAMVRKVTKNNFTVGRGVQSCNTADMNANRYPLETFNLMSCSADNSSEADMKLMVDNAVSKRRWLTFYMHQTDAADATKLANVISYVQSTYPTAKIVTITQGYNLLKNFVDYENAYGENYRIGVDGSMTFNNAIFQEGISEMVPVIGKQAIPVIHAYRAPGTTGYNFFIGPNAGNFTMSGTGSEASTNLGVGNQVLQSLTTGKDNTAAGIGAMLSNTTGTSNSALGRSALYYNTTGVNSTAVGYRALYSNQTSGYHTAIGVNALKDHTTSDGSTAFGTNALQSDVSGYQNTAVGLNALQAKTTGNYNTAIGTNAGYSLTGAASNIFIGHSAGFSNLTGASNVFIGYQAGYNETSSNKLYIANSSTLTPLIYGDFINNIIGIGTSTPWATLSVEGNTTFAAGSPLFVVATSTPTATSTAFIVDGSGNVGIGTSTPGNTFAVQGTGAFNSWLSADYFLATSTTATSTLAGGLQTDTLDVQSTTATSTFGNGLRVETGGLSLDQLLNCNSLDTDASGNLICGTDEGSTFAQAWEINAGGLLAPTTTQDILANSNLFVTGDIDLYGGDINLGTGSATSTLTSSSGNLGIGTSSPYATLSVAGDSTFDSNVINIASSSASSLTLNYLSPATSTIPTTGNWNIANNTTDIPIFTIEGSTGSIGIGTSSPFARLTASSTNLVTAVFDQNGTSDIMQLWDAGSPVFVVQDGGNVGVGTTTPWARLTVEQLANDANVFVIADEGTSTPALRVDGAGITYIDQLQTGPMNFDTNAGALSWVDMQITSAAATGTPESYTASIDSVPILTIYAESDEIESIQTYGVGIGTTSPFAFFSVSAASTTQYITQSPQPVAVFYNSSSTELFRIDSGSNNNNIGFGTTSPAAKISLEGISADVTPLFMMSTSTASATTTSFMIDSNGLLGIGSSTPYAELSVLGKFAIDGLASIGVTSNPLCLVGKDVMVGTGADCTASSERYKYDIQDQPEALPIIMSLHPTSFKLKATDEPRLGLIAEEVYSVEPRLADLDKEGLPASVRYAEMTSVLTKAIQEMNLKIENLSSQTSVDSSQTGQIFSFDGILSWLSDKIVRVKEFIAEKITAKKVVTDSLEMKDSITGETYCVRISNGEWEKVKGECENTSDQSSAPSSQVEQTGVETQPQPQTEPQEPFIPNEIEGEPQPPTPEIIPEPEAEPVPEEPIEQPAENPTTE